MDDRRYGDGDASYQAMGGDAGVRQLVDRFYDLMESLPEARTIRDMHGPDLGLSRDKLHIFLCGWLGGPRRYAERWGPIAIPPAHAHLPIGPAERDQWLLCMDRALAEMPVAEDFKAYFREQIRVPAERVTQVCTRMAQAQKQADDAAD
ncbi:MAG: group II truncated hemoglobin [Myxococcales bacterium]|nr:group II truncated hemoglobin [Myxococcales bacterium]